MRNDIVAVTAVMETVIKLSTLKTDLMRLVRLHLCVIKGIFFFGGGG